MQSICLFVLLSTYNMHQSDIRYTFPNKLDITDAIGEVLHCLKLTCIGNEGNITQTSKTFRTLMWMTVNQMDTTFRNDTLYI